jgi:O-antigen/teichoic acid export membrane protein
MKSNWFFLDASPAQHVRPEVNVEVPNSIRHNALWTVVGDGVYAACQWGMLIVIAKFGTLEMVGQFALGLAITAPIIIGANLALRAIQATDAKSEYEFSEYLGLRLMTTTMAFMCIAALSVMFRLETSMIVLSIALAKGIEAISEIYYALLQKHERMHLIATSMIIKGVLSLAALTAALYLTGNLLWGITALAVVWALVLFGYDIPNGARILERFGRAATARPCWRFARLRRLAWLAFPLGLTMLLLTLNANIPRYFVERYLGERELGLFATMAYFMVVGGAFVNAVGQSVSPRLAKYWADNSDQAFHALLLKLVVLVAVIGVASVGIALLAGSELLTLLYGPEYAARSDVFVWIMAAAAIAYLASAFGYGLTAARLIRIQPVQFICVTAAGMACCMLLIPTHGLRGAAWAAGVSLLVQLLIAVMCLLYAFRRRATSGHVYAAKESRGEPAVL